MSARRWVGQLSVFNEFSADWLDNFNANLVCISATRVSELIEDHFPLFIRFQVQKIRSTGGI